MMDSRNGGVGTGGGKRLTALAGGAAAAMLLMGARAEGVERVWFGTQGNWDIASNWTPNTSAPLNGDTVVIAKSAANVNYVNTIAPPPSYPTFKVDLSGAGTAPTFTQTQHVLNVNEMLVGVNSGGAVVHSGGTNNVGSMDAINGLQLGVQAAGNGSYTLNSAAVLNVSGQLIVADSGTGTFTHNNGTVNLNYGAFPGVLAIAAGSTSTGTYNMAAGSLTLGTLQASPYGFGGTGTFNQNGGTVTALEGIELGDMDNLTPTGTGTYNHNAGALTTPSIRVGRNGRFKHAGGGTLVTGGLQVSTNGGRLDLTNQAMVVDYGQFDASPYAGIEAAVKSGFAGGNWNGSGINSTVAAADALDRSAIGYGEASDVLGLTGGATTTWNGVVVDSTSVLVRYTRYGDASLNGAVDLSDLVLLATYYGTQSGAIWAKGDFDYDGVVGLNDLVTLATHYGLPAPAAVELGDGSPASAAFMADMQLAFSSVPEPGGVGVIGAGLVMLLRRRRR